MRRWLLSVLLGSLAGCVAYHPKPIDAPMLESGYRARSLTDPGLGAFVAANSPSLAAEWPPATLNLDALSLIAFYFSPDLDVARERVALAEAGLISAGARPNPTVGVGAGYTDLPESPFLFRFSFDLPIETGGKRGLRIARARHMTEAARLELAETGWRVRSRVRAALLEHLLAAREVDLLRAEEKIRAEAVGLVQRRVAVGEASRPELDAARVDVAAARLAIEAAQGRRAETRAQLAAALGLSLSGLDGARFEWPELEQPPPEEALSALAVQRDGLLNRLEVRRALSEYAAAEAALQMEVARQRPDIHLGPGYSFDDAANKYNLGISAALPLRNRNEGPIAETEARRQQAAAQFLALQARIIGETEAALARYRAARAELAEADRALLAPQQRRQAAIERAFELGEADRLALAGVRVQTALAARERLVALRRTQVALGDLENAVQRPLAPPSTAPEVPPSNPRETTQRQEAR